MGGHTPTPWRLNAGNEIQIMGATQRTVARAECGGMSGIKLAEAEANARRIVASVNATAGISVEALEAGVIGELVEALEGLCSWDDELTQDKWDYAREVLAKIKGEA